MTPKEKEQLIKRTEKLPIVIIPETRDYCAYLLTFFPDLAKNLDCLPTDICLCEFAHTEIKPWAQDLFLVLQNQKGKTALFETFVAQSFYGSSIGETSL